MLLSLCCLPSTRGWASQLEPELLLRAFTLVCLVSRHGLISYHHVCSFIRPQPKRSWRSSHLCWSHNCSMTEKAVLRGPDETILALARVTCHWQEWETDDPWQKEEFGDGLQFTWCQVRGEVCLPEPGWRTWQELLLTSPNNGGPAGVLSLKKLQIWKK